MFGSETCLFDYKNIWLCFNLMFLKCFSKRNYFYSENVFNLKFHLEIHLDLILISLILILFQT